VNFTNYVDILYVVGNIDWWISEIQSFAIKSRKNSAMLCWTLLFEEKPRYGLAAVADPKDSWL